MATSIKTLEVLVRRINEATDSPLEPWSRKETGASAANIGNYHLYGAYGGWALHRIDDESGGIREIWGCSPKRDLETFLRGFLEGLS